MSKTLVIGGTGYIGRHLKKVKPDFIYASRSDFDLNNIDKIKSYLNQLEIDICLILAASIGYENKISFSSEPFTSNVMGLNNLLSVLNKKTKIIYFSSMTVYDKSELSAVKEDSNLLPSHGYGLSKVFAEKLIEYYNFNSVIIRIPGVYGGDRKEGIIYNTILNLSNNKDIKIDTKSLVYWETIHIEDLLLMFIEFLNNYNFNEKFDIYNLSYGEETDIIDTVHFLKNELNSLSNIYISKCYNTLFLSNEKALKFVNKPLRFKDRLKLYLKEII